MSLKKVKKHLTISDVPLGMPSKTSGYLPTKLETDKLKKQVKLTLKYL